MAVTQGLIQNNFKTGYRLELEWSRIGVDEQTLTSIVEVKSYLVSTMSGYNIVSSVDRENKITVDNDTRTNWVNLTLNSLQRKLLATETFGLVHSPGQTRDFSLSGSQVFNFTFAGSYTGTVYLGPETFKLPELSEPPEVETLSAINVMAHSARVRGNLIATGDTQTEVAIHFGESPNNYNRAFYLGTRNELGEFFRDVDDLQPDKNYYYRAGAHNIGGTVWGAEQSFKTRILSNVWTDSASNVGAYSARISGQLLSTGGEEVTCYIQYGESPGNYNLGLFEFGPFSEPSAVYQELTSLEVQKTYYFRAYAVSPAGTVYGQERSFTTVAYDPDVKTELATLIDYQEATFNGYLADTGGALTDCYFEYGETEQFELGELWVEQKSEPGAFSLPLTGLDYDTAYYFRAKAVNEIGQDVGVTRTFETPYPEITAPSESFPESGTKYDNVRPTFAFTLGGNELNPAVTLHARIRFSEYVGMNPLTLDLESKGELNGWEAFLNSTWEPFPVGGVPPYTRVRYTPQTDLPFGSIYWDGAAWDGHIYGEYSQPRLLRITVEPEGIYTLVIGTTEWEFVEMLTITEASNGEIGSIEFILDNQDGLANDIEHGDQVVLAIRDFQGEVEDYLGRVRRLIPEGNDLRIVAILGDGFLAERIIREDYLANDVGQIVADIITEYLAPLTTEYVDTNTGFTAPVTADKRTAVRVLEEIRRNFGLYYYVDKQDRFHLYRPEDIVEPLEPLKIRRGDNG